MILKTIYVGDRQINGQSWNGYVVSSCCGILDYWYGRWWRCRACARWVVKW